jgi:hypothetical protein
MTYATSCEVIVVANPLLEEKLMELMTFACAKSMKGLSAVTDESRGDRGRHGALAD